LRRFNSAFLTVLRKSPVNRELSRNMSKAFPKSQKLSVRRAASVTTLALMVDGFIANIFAPPARASPGVNVDTPNTEVLKVHLQVIAN
jgi:hypothetical protein